jgi:transglutaminase-like putative cysteine protease
MTAAATAAPDVSIAKHSATRRTLLALLACALAATPLKSLLSDNRWLGDGWLTMAIVVGPAALLRLRRPPSAIDIWPGVILLIPWLTLLYVPKHAWGGFIPTGATFSDVARLMDSLHRTTTNEIAPIHSTVAVRLVLCALLGLLAALVDLVAVVGRRGALAGIPLLVVYTVSGAVPRTPVAWFWFGVAAVGYLILLSLDAADELREWGRRVSRPGANWSRQGMAFSAYRIGVFAVLIAVMLPFLVPGHPRNLIADAFHSSNGSNGIGGIGAGGGSGSINPFAALKGQLQRHKAAPVMRVHVASSGSVTPFYARLNVLDKFTGNGWTVSDHGGTEPIGLSGFGTQPITSEPRTTTFQAQITINGLIGNAPVFSIPRSVEGLDSSAGWSGQDQLLLGSEVHAGDHITEVVAQPDPTVQDLQLSPAATGADFSRYLQLPTIPAYVRNLVNQITSGQQSSYDKARVISDWFANPANGFVYSLKTVQGDSGSQLVDFLQNRTGFCQQYAAAMGVMLRLAGVPARVVLGYMHAAPDRNGNFTVTTFDAHAWVEAFFPGSGRIAFDPTPTAGLTGGKKSDLAWAPHVYESQAGAQGPTLSGRSSAGQRNSPSASTSHAAPSAGPARSSSNLSLLWTALVILLVAGAALTPAATRAWRRRRRFAAARHGDADALWAELSDTAVDLGYVWSPARSPRQVSAWLAADAAETAPALDALAVAVEQRRYAPTAAPRDTQELARGLHDVTHRLWSRRGGRTRLWARLWPASLGWGKRLGGVRGAVRRKH